MKSKFNTSSLFYKSLFFFALLWISASTAYAQSIAITSPTNGQTVGANTNVNITVSTSGSITSVVYWVDNFTWIGQVNTAPYTLVWNANVANGSHILRARANFSNGTTIDATTVSINVGVVVAVTGVTVSPASASVVAGATTTLTATVSPSNASNKTVTWSSGNTSVATVSSAGVVTGVAAGSATITATTQDGGKKATSAITVTASGGGGGSATVNFENLPAGTLVSPYGDPSGYTFTGTNGSGQGENFSIQTNNSTKSLLNANWTSTITLKRTDNAAFTLTSFSYHGDPWNGSASATVTGTTSTGGTLTSSFTGGANFATLTLNWANLKTVVIAFPNAYGEVDNFVLSSGGGGTTVPVTGVSVSPTSVSLTSGATTSLTATVSPSNATNKTVTWKTSNAAVATVNSSGVVSGVAAGTATMTVTTQDGAKTATSTITVTSSTGGGTRPAGNTGVGFYVNNGKVYDPNNTLFQAMGVNAGVFWYEDQTLQFNSIPIIDRENANFVRIIAQTSGQFGWNTTPQIQRTFIDSLVKHRIVPMLEMHDATCDNDALTQIFNYWNSAAMVQLAKDEERYLWINLANEHNFASAVDWKNTYITEIQTLRGLGVKNVIVLDQDANCGQDPKTAETYFQDVLNADPQHNVIFSIHMYTFWRTAEKASEVGTWDASTGAPWSVETELQFYSDHHIPVIVAEFNWDSPSNPSCLINPRTMIAKAESLGIGWSFWAWYDQADNSLDVVTDITNPTTLTPAGQWLVPHWQANAKRASIFNGLPSGSVLDQFGGAEIGGRLKEGISLYPNPVSQTLHITLNSLRDARAEIFVVDVTGRLVRSVSQTVYAGRNDFNISMENLPNGTYFIRTVNAGRQFINKFEISK